MRFIKKLILIAALLFMSKPILVYAKKGDVGVVPMFSITWDKNIGFNYGGGIAIGLWETGVFEGGYGSLTYSKKGYNLSFGHYIGLGVATSRVGINRMVIKKDNANEIYWGIESSPSFLIGHLRGGVMFGGIPSEKKITFVEFRFWFWYILNYMQIKSNNRVLV